VLACHFVGVIKSERIRWVEPVVFGWMGEFKCSENKEERVTVSCSQLNV
jgi:hypothetical protein